ncbi:trypsin-like serine protease [Linderina pennispora]|uniref:Trypsin-like serine protease n=1 Tax=Linderina pennispora TaxID=61395 RepID=A0A1Y1VYQ0_9FUNG|nr:trypsin-like serine protease [Linderina pennispora]ORX66136.1 trypsin-like serine protease [Linderina pennispora]
MACLAIAQTNGTQHKTVPRIVGGSPMTSKGYGFTAYIIAHGSDNTAGLCTGVLITPTAVITAAHCVFPDSKTSYGAADYEIWFGLDAPTQATKTPGFKVSRIQWASDYSLTTLLADVAVLHLSSPVPDTVAVPTKIYTGPVYQDTPVWAAGFGRTRPNDSKSQSSVLMYVGLRLGSSSYCNAHNDNYDSSSQLCTSYLAGRDTCLGDSGGPLMTPTDGEYPIGVVGITSMSTYPQNDPNAICARSDITGYYTRLEYFIGMITKAVGVSASEITVSNTTTSRPAKTDDNTDNEAVTATRAKNTDAAPTSSRSSLPTGAFSFSYSFESYSYTKPPSPTLSFLSGVVMLNSASPRAVASVVALVAAALLLA